MGISTMRLFTGIDLPEPVAGRVAALIERLRPVARLRWSVPENLHITTKFIGEWPEASLSDLVNVLTAMPPHAEIPISLPGVGWFPNPHHPRLLWASVQAGPTLRQLAADTGQALEGLGIVPEKRAYTPHLTLARVDERASAADLRALRIAVAELAETQFGEFVAVEFCLYKSEPTPRGSRYTMLSRFPLDADANGGSE
jgi:2'-5' RNA ligase